jgi:hypothetical protein
VNQRRHGLDWRRGDKKECSFVLRKRTKKKELLFVNKKKQKNFDYFWPVALERPREAEQKFFGSFFQKRTPCFLNFGRLGRYHKKAVLAA